MNNLAGISVIMPTYNQGAFIKRAITSLFAQHFNNWELIIVNDGSSDYTEDLVQEYIQEGRIHYYKNSENKGLGFCLNLGIQYANYEYISYLPSDDIYYADHLSSLFSTLSVRSDAVLCYSGLTYNNSDNYATGLSVERTVGPIEDKGLQLVQVMHRKTAFKWVERDVFVTADLNKMFWEQLKQVGQFVGSKNISCEWVSHPLQRHKIISKKFGGGLPFYKEYYGVKESLSFYTDGGECINEEKKLTERQNIRIAPGKLKILIVGELGFNPERLSVLEEHGHRLFGVWIPNPDLHNSVGPFSFGNIITLNVEHLKKQIEEVRPDIIYALLNTQAVRLAHYVMTSNPDIPFVWHFKEGPFFCRNAGIWKELFELYYNADGRIYINEECKDWYEQFIGDQNRPSYILDGDLPPKKWFTDIRSPLLSSSDGETHTVMAGRPYGITPSDMAVLASHKVHLHLYGEFYQKKWKAWVNESEQMASGYLHLHSHCKPENWSKEFSQYDAGWLHCFESENQGELIRCSWDDLNYPARMSTLAVGGLPMIQKNNNGHKVSSQRLLEKLQIGVLFRSFDDLGGQLNEKDTLNQLKENCWRNRERFSFDYYIDDLLTFFENVIATKKQNN
ncbi:glycosyltransferase family 2 protein [Niabella sp. CC-SYL272]|uniref:glycosyltransferase family 2 protein n=1 Tax=Niabella agricola TaxID=2891571 RepID=UPI001F392639|nr:glycosyltransferase family A protein [Niabella agricola]MCF3110626.1 glycosyltransferase family 2 protein [Niabella agricola]